MLRSNGLHFIAVGLVAFCLSTASADERVTYNKTVLDCVPEGCFVVRYIPAPRLKPLNNYEDGNKQGSSHKKTTEQKQKDRNNNSFVTRSEPESEANNRAGNDAEAEKENRSPVKRRNKWDRLRGLVNSADAITAWGTVFAAIAAAIGVILLIRQLDLIQKLFINERRPWLSISCNLSNEIPELQTNQSGEAIYFELRCESKNQGGSPALNVHFDAEMALLSTESGRPEEIMRTYSDKIRGRNRDTGEAVFPNFEDSFSCMVCLSLLDVRNDIASKDFKCISPIVYGCLTYQSAFSDKIFQTRFCYYLTHVSDEGEAQVIMPSDDRRWISRRFYLVRPCITEAD